MVIKQKNLLQLHKSNMQSKHKESCNAESYPNLPQKMIGENLIALAILTINLPPGLHHLYT